MTTRIDREAFEEWRENAMTEALLRALTIGEKRITDAWLEMSLEGGRCDALELARLRERMHVYREIRAMTAEKLEEVLNV